MARFRTAGARVAVGLLLSCVVARGDARAQKRYYRGNTHTHSYPASSDIQDPTYTPPKVVGGYKALGYDFLLFTDHENWWNAAWLSTGDFTVLNGSESASGGFRQWGHFTALNSQGPVNGAGLTRQQMIDAIDSQGGVAFLNHPRMQSMPITARQVIDQMRHGLEHLEIYNALTSHSPPGDDVSVWDSVLATGRMIYGVASDDSHAAYSQGKAWIMVRSASVAADSLVQAIRAGDFYASTGVVLDSVDLSPERVFVKSGNGDRIRFIGWNGWLLSTIDSSEAEYQTHGYERYVRAEVSNAAGQRAWTQPVMVPLIPPTAADPEGVGSGSSRYGLRPSYPEPFNSSTTITYGLPDRSVVMLSVYNALGRRVAILVDREQEAGYHHVRFDASDLPSGTYYCRLQAGKSVAAKKMVLLR